MLEHSYFSSESYHLNITAKRVLAQTILVQAVSHPTTPHLQFHCSLLLRWYPPLCMVMCLLICYQGVWGVGVQGQTSEYTISYERLEKQDGTR